MAAGVVYLAAAELGRRRDRRSRRWPLGRTACFLGGLAVLLVALDSAIGAGADEHLTDHLVEHMLIWLVVAPLLVAGAPIRLALFATVVVTTQMPGVFDLTLENDLVHVTEHAAYLLTAVLVWAPLVRADPLPHRVGIGGRCWCVAACMVPMAAVSIWLLAAGAPVYGPYREALGTATALHDQRVAGVIMLAAAAPALALALLAPLAAASGSLTTPGPDVYPSTSLVPFSQER